MKTIVVGVLEHATDSHPALTEKYAALFASAGFAANIECFATEQLLRDFLATRVASVAIIDVSLGQEENMAGLHVISRIKKDFPEICVIGNSQHPITYRHTAARLPTFDLYVDKGNFLSCRSDDSGYFPKLRAQLKEVVTISETASISSDSELPEPLKKRKRDVESLLAQVLSSRHAGDPAADIDNVRLTQLHGGRSKSFVFRVDAWNGRSGLSAVPSVLKISPREDAERELNNYHKFVKWLLPYNWRVDVLGVGKTREYGAIAYSFIFSGNQPFDALTKYLEEADAGTVRLVMKEIFSPEMQKWYEPRSVQSERGLTEHYRQLYFDTQDSLNKLDDSFKLAVQKLFSGQIDSYSVRTFGEKFGLPHAALFGKPRDGFQSCICHGDLNSNNVIVAKNGAVIFIDFQNTGRGHVFGDFINLELSVRAYFDARQSRRSGGNGGSGDIEAFTREMSDYSGAQDDYGSLIAEIRSLAKQNFPDEEFSNYYYGVAVQGCRLMKVQSLGDLAQGRILLGVLSAMKKLEKRK